MAQNVDTVCSKCERSGQSAWEQLARQVQRSRDRCQYCGGRLAKRAHAIAGLLRPDTESS
jgi:DNA-directed RNA polymerase subunit RPC12/RpoP